MGSKSGNSRNGLYDVRYSRPTATNLLSRIDPEEFKLLRVAIRRKNITATGPLGCLERDVDEPAAITPLVHKVNSKVNLPLFGHNIEVNKEFEQQQPKEKPQENRFVLADANRAEEEREKYKPSRSPSRQRRVSRSRSRERYNFREKERRSRSRSRSRSPDVETRKRHTLSRPLRPGEYVPNHPDLKTRRARSRSTEKREQRSHSRERTVKPSTSDPKSLRLYSRSPGRRSRSRSKTPARYDRDRKRSRSPRRRSPSRSRYRSRSRSPRYERRRSRSPYRPRYGRPMEMVPPEYAFYPHWNPMGPMGPGMMPHQYMPPPGMIRNPYMFAPRMPYQPFPRMNMMSKLRPPSTVVGTSATITDIKQINKDADIENLKDKIESEKSAVEEKDKAEEPVPEISLSN